MDTTTFNKSMVLNNSLNASVIQEIVNDHFQRYESVSLVLVGLYVPVFFLGIFGNGFLAIIILNKEPLRNVTNLFLCSLALADLAGERVEIA